MSGLYNMLFGVNEAAPVLLAILGVTSDQVPRFRDCYLTEDGKIAIYTRTGGGNRDHYEDCTDGPSNEDLRQLPGFVSDKDDEFDCTYATFYYEIPEETKKALALHKILPPEIVPGENFQVLIKKLEDPAMKDDPEVLHALEVGRPIVEKIAGFFKPDEEKREGTD